jgi:hypothetical protein
VVQIIVQNTIKNRFFHVQIFKALLIPKNSEKNAPPKKSLSQKSPDKTTMDGGFARRSRPKGEPHDVANEKQL